MDENGAKDSDLTPMILVLGKPDGSVRVQILDTDLHGAMMLAQSAMEGLQETHAAEPAHEHPDGVANAASSV